jgi:hypothetical protein
MPRLFFHAFIFNASIYSMRVASISPYVSRLLVGACRVYFFMRLVVPVRVASSCSCMWLGLCMSHLFVPARRIHFVCACRVAFSLRMPIWV